MKWLIYALLLVNLSLFVWHYQSAGMFMKPSPPVPSTARPSSDEGVKRLRLLSEAPATVKKTGTTAGPVQCRGLGPFPGHKSAQAALAVLQAAGLQWGVVDAVLPDKTGYWVYLPPFRSRKAAREAISALKAQGIRDYFLVGTGEQKNGVSLGVFSTRVLAQQRIAQIRDKGMSPVLGTVSLAQHQYWLVSKANRVQADTNKEETTALDVLHAGYPQVSGGQFLCAPARD